jgi:hypothetical protein
VKLLNTPKFTGTQMQLTTGITFTKYETSTINGLNGVKKVADVISSTATTLPYSPACSIKAKNSPCRAQLNLENCITKNAA